MKEIYEFRINYDYAHLLFNDNEGKNLGAFEPSVKVVHLTKDDPKYERIGILNKQIKDKYDKSFFFGWGIKRRYTRKEIESAQLFHVTTHMFEPAGEECGTVYDETVACEICGADRKQVNHLVLKKNSIPKKDIAETIAGEIVVSEKFVNAVKRRAIKGILFSPVILGKEISNYYQLLHAIELNLSKKTLAGIHPFDLSTRSGGETYLCPQGHTIGLNLLSEPFVENNPLIYENDFFASKQKLGVKRGLLRPYPLYLCSQAFKKMVEEEKLSGFGFSVVNVE